MTSPDDDQTPDTSWPGFVPPAFPTPEFPSPGFISPGFVSSGLPGDGTSPPLSCPSVTPPDDVTPPAVAPPLVQADVPAEVPPEVSPAEPSPPLQPAPSVQPPPAPVSRPLPYSVVTHNLARPHNLARRPDVLPAKGARAARPVTAWVWGGVALVLLALVIWLFVRPSSSGPAPAPASSLAPVPSGPFPPFTDTVPDIISRPSWSPALPLELPDGLSQLDAISAKRGDIVIITSRPYTFDRSVYEAVDLASMKILWTRSYDTAKVGDYVRLYADEGGLVFAKESNKTTTVDVVNTLTGEVFATAAFDTGESVLAVESGIVITGDTFYDSFCARTLTDPSVCKWRAPGVGLDSIVSHCPLIFGGDKWVNTSKGVLELATGKAASFGADATNGNSSDSMVYYVGDSADRIFRVDCLYVVGGNNICHYQPWDTEQDKALLPPVKANFGTALSGQDTFIGVEYMTEDSVQVTAYSWATGEKQWQVDQTCYYGQCEFYNISASFSGNFYALTLDWGNAFFFDTRTGQEMFPDRTNDLLGGVRYVFISPQVVYLASQRAIIACDATADGLPQLWSSKTDNYAYGFFAVAHHIFAVFDKPGQLRVLQQ